MKLSVEFYGVFYHFRRKGFIGYIKLAGKFVHLAVESAFEAIETIKVVAFVLKISGDALEVIDGLRYTGKTFSLSDPTPEAVPDRDWFIMQEGIQQALQGF